jgi:ABC-type multidrug transport system fused ATPase/permease subunit
MIIKRILDLLLPEERKKGWRVAGSVFLSAMLDFIGLAALLPILYYLLEDGEQHRAALWFCLLAVGVILLKSILQTAFSRYQQRFLLDLYKRMSFSLFTAYYRRGLLFIREQGVNRLGYEVNFICYAFSLNILAPILWIVGDGLLILLVLLALLVYDWFTFLILIISFLPFVWVYIITIRKHARKFGKQELDARRKQTRVVTETFGGFAELEVNNAFFAMQNIFQEGLEQITQNRMKMDILAKIPLFLSALSVIVGLTLLTILGNGDVKIVLGIFAVAAFRLLPAVKGILSGWTLIQNSSSSLQVIEEGLKKEQIIKSKDNDLEFQREITIRSLSYKYQDSETVFRNFHCSIRKGEYIGFQGYSGAGKSTLFNLLLGFLKPQEGGIWIDDIPLSPQVQEAWLKKTGYVQQDVFIFQGTLAENIALGCKDIDRDKINHILKQVCLYDWVHTLPYGMDTSLGEYGGKISGGQRQRIGIARALYKEAEVIFLDEATSALDNDTEKDINTMLASLRDKYPGLTILSIAHRESSLSYCDRIITIE